MREVYDYVIVGAGSAGCVLGRPALSRTRTSASRCSRPGREDTQPEIHIPAAFPALFKSSLDWDLLGEQEPGLDNRRLYLPRGQDAGRLQLDQRDDLHPRQPCRLRRLGGGRCWQAGATTTCCRTSSARRTTSAARTRSTAPADRWRWPKAARCTRWWTRCSRRRSQAGHEHNPDFNGARQEGVGRFQLTQRDGWRASTADAFLRPAAGGRT